MVLFALGFRFVRDNLDLAVLTPGKTGNIVLQLAMQQCYVATCKLQQFVARITLPLDNNVEAKASVCLSHKDQTRMFYLAYQFTYLIVQV